MCEVPKYLVIFFILSLLGAMVIATLGDEPNVVITDDGVIRGLMSVESIEKQWGTSGIVQPTDPQWAEMVAEYEASFLKRPATYKVINL